MKTKTANPSERLPFCMGENLCESSQHDSDMAEFLETCQ